MSALRTLRAPTASVVPAPATAARRRSFLGAPLAAARRPIRMTGVNGRGLATPVKAEVSDVLTGAVNIDIGKGSDDVYGSVQNYYGEVLETSEDLKTSACCTPNRPHPIIRDILRKVPDEVCAKYYGCGSPFPFGIDGLRVLDLGSGSGRDCYVCSALVGESGKVTGIDMTANQLSVARKYVDEYTAALGYASPNMSFVEGKIEDLASAGVADSSVDLVISNCVVNLSPDKRAVLSEVYRALSDGGEFYFSDVYCDRRLPMEVRQDDVLLGECLGGALYVEDFKRLCHQVGFTDPRSMAMTPIEVKDPKLQDLLGEAKFYSITYRLFKLPGRLETLCEDYGQYAIYKGTIPGHPHAYSLDDHHRIEKNKPFLVCGNTASMLGETWLGKHFDIHGDRSVHYGLFPCGPEPAAAPGGAAAGGGCC